jgi:transcriptional regulator with XRE-family HTH domain
MATAKAKPKKKAGRKKEAPGPKSGYTLEKAQMAARAAARGMHWYEIAELLGVSRRTLWNWRMDHPEFEAALTIEAVAANNRVEMSMYQMAVGYDIEEVEKRKIKVGKTVTEETITTVKHYPAVPAAAIHWTKARMGWQSESIPQVPKDDGPALVEGAQEELPSLRQVARQLAFILNQAAKGAA